MRRAFIFSLVFAMVSITACGENDHPVLSEQHEQANGEENNENQETDMENSIIKLTVGGRSFTATLVNNSSTDALKEHLAQGDLSIRMNDYGDMEKVGSLGFSLPRNDRQTTTGPGDLILMIRTPGISPDWDMWTVSPPERRCSAYWEEREK